MMSKAYAKQFSCIAFKLFADYGSRLLLFPVTACQGLIIK